MAPVVAIIAIVATKAGLVSAASALAFATSYAFVITSWAVTISATVGYSSYARRKSEKKMAAAMANLDTGREVMVRDAVAPRRIIYGQCVVSGVICYAQTTGTSNEFLYLVIKLADHECEELGDIYFDDALVPLDGSGNATGDFAGYATVRKYVGLAAGERDTTLETDSGGDWTANHLGKSVARLHVKLKHNPDLFPQGIPTIKCVVKGRKVYDFRTATTGYSNNAALCLADYLMDARYGKGVSLARINSAAVIEAANICDESVNLNPSGTEARYTCNGVINSDEDPNDVLAELAGCMAGGVVDAGGQWTIHAGAYRTPTVTLTDDDLAGAFTATPRLSRQDTFNGVRGTYYSPDNQWAAADFPAVINDTYKAADGGVRLWRDMALRFTTSSATAQRLAKIELERGRQQIIAQARYKLKAMQFQPGDVVLLTRERLGWTDKPFEVINWHFVVEGADNPALAIKVTMRETAAEVWDWSSGEQTVVDLAPNTTLVNPSAAGSPTGLTLTSSYFEQEDGTIFPRLKASWTAAALEQVKVGGFVWIEYKKTADSTWLIWGSLRGNATEDYITDILIGTSYDVRIRFQNTFGAYSSYSSTATATPAGDTTAPAQVTGLTATGGAGFIALLWTPLDKAMYPDLAEYAVYRNPANDFATATVIAEVSSSSFIDPSVTVGTTYYFWVAAVDRSENVGLQSAVASAAATAPISVVAPSTPSAPTYSSDGTYLAGDGTAFAYIVITLPGPPSGAIVLDVLYRISGSSSWILADQLGSAGNSRIDDLTCGASYEFACRGVSNGGKLSSVSSTLSRTAPNPGAPSAPTGLALSNSSADLAMIPEARAGAGGAKYGACMLTWTASTSSNVAYYEVWRTSGIPVLLKRTAGTETRIPLYAAIEINPVVDDIFIKAVSRTGVASSASSSIFAPHTQFSSDYGTASMAEQDSDAVDITGGTIEAAEVYAPILAVGATSASSVREVVARYPVIVTAHSLTGGAPSENIDVSLSNRGFTAKPQFGTAHVYSGNDQFLIRYDYGSGSSSSTNARLVIYTIDGSNLPSGTIGFCALFEQYA